MKVFNITKRSKLWFSIPVVITIIGIVLMFTKGFNLGIDFTGGTTIQADFGKKVEIEKVRDVMKDIDKNATITYAGDKQQSVLIKTTLVVNDEQRTSILNTFDKDFGLKPTDIQFESIGATIGGEMRRDAVIAVLLAVIGITAYITFRFEFRFGLASIVALVHDVIIMMCAYLIFQIQVNSSLIAALLTIVGYSINNTIVVFDRVRENKKGRRRPELNELVNKSVSETLTRSFNTTITTLITIVVLYILGVPAIREFALPLIVGLLAGAYSSILMAGPFWKFLEEKRRAKAA